MALLTKLSFPLFYLFSFLFLFRWELFCGVFTQFLSRGSMCRVKEKKDNTTDFAPKIFSYARV